MVAINSDGLRVALVQTALVWENPKVNLDILTKKIAHLKRKTDIILLPEMFSTGFSMNVQCAEPFRGDTVKWMMHQARELRAVITGSVMIEEEGKYYNRLIWMQPDGVFFQYDKKHLFSLTNEPQVFEAGTKKLLVEWKGWKICPLVCYDLRFPAWARNQEDYDVLFYVANFPERRRYAWRQLLIARAIENQCYTLGVNIVGTDGNGIEYVGDSVVLDSQGKVLEEITGEEGVIHKTLSKAELQRVRKKYPFLKDRDKLSVG